MSAHNLSLTFNTVVKVAVSWTNFDSELHGIPVDWTDQGIVLHTRPHGETSAVLEVLTGAHGRHLGLVRGATSRRMRGSLQPGNTLQVTWRARLADHLGAFAVEPATERTALVLGDRRALVGLTAAIAVASAALPEREPHPRLFDGLTILLDALDEAGTWPALLARWELRLLEDLGFGLDLSACAVTGTTEGLAYVSPRTGRAVTAAAAGDYRDRLLPLPAFLAGSDRSPTAAEVAAALRLTGFFMEARIFRPAGSGLPAARVRLAEVLQGAGGTAQP